MSCNRLIILCLIFSLSEVNSQNATYINPGIKLGYAFGDNGGFVFGLEISIVEHSGSDFVYGFVLSFDHINDAAIFHAGFEATGAWLIGIEVGPSFMLKNGEKSYGFGITPYAGFILMPYMNISWFSNKQSFFQFGSYIKIPLQLRGKRFSLAG